MTIAVNTVDDFIAFRAEKSYDRYVNFMLLLVFHFTSPQLINSRDPQLQIQVSKLDELFFRETELHSTRSK